MNREWQDPCPTCRVAAGHPCRTSAGGLAKLTHSARTRVFAKPVRKPRPPCPHCGATSTFGYVHASWCPEHGKEVTR